jgi:hypothetical protein
MPNGWRLRRTAPRLGEHTVEALDELGSGTADGHQAATGGLRLGSKMNEATTT